MENNIDILTIGDVSIDLYLKIADEDVSEDTSLEQPRICFYHGSKIPVKTLKTSIAGNSINVGVGTNSLGLKTAIYAELGDDEYSDRIIRELKEKNIVTDFLVKNKDTQTNIHPIIVYNGERTIFSHHEVRNYKMLDWPTPKWIYYTSLRPGFEAFQKNIVDYLKKNPQIGVAFNPGTYQMKSGLEKLRNILEVTHVLLVNKEEAERFVGKGDIETLHKNLQKLGPKLTVITEGKQGASGHDGKNFEKIKAYITKEPVLDRTGAGDAFGSGFVSALFYKKSLKEALIWGAINSSSVIKKVGSIYGLKNKEDMEALAEKLKDEL